MNDDEDEDSSDEEGGGKGKKAELNETVSSNFQPPPFRFFLPKLIPFG